MADLKKSAIITFLGNANHDSRVVNLISSLSQIGISTKTVSFDWKTKDFNTQLGNTTIYKLDKSKSSLIYYLNFLFLLIRNLLKSKAQFYFAEDIYTLPVTYFFAKKNNAKIFYNSREIYAHLGGLRNKSIVQKIIAKIESLFIRKVDLVLATGELDAEFLQKSYSIDNFFVLRNLPKYVDEISKIDLHKRLNISPNKKILLYQGVLLEGRGISKIISIMESLNNTHLILVGDGEFRYKFENLARLSNAADRIHFIGAINHNELLNYTACADIGLSIIENISISYYYALPNKLFEYIMAGIPILASNLPQMKKVIDQYNVGKIIEPENDSEVISVLQEMLMNDEQIEIYKRNCRRAAQELNWEVEFNKFKEVLLT